MPEAESPQPPESRNQQAPDEADALLDQVLAAPEGSWSAALDRLCHEFPDHSRLLRQRFGYLQRCGMIPPDGHGEGTPTPTSFGGRPSAGSRFGPYDLETILGHGAMGIVFRAVHRETGARVAVKVIRPELLEDPAARRRFLNEGKIAARIEHPHLCRVHEVGEVDGTPFLAMDLLAGETLASRLERARRLGRPLSHGWPGVVALFEKVARGLGKAHASGLVHRDVKPGNLMLGEDGEPVLFDFGLAYCAETTRLTRTGTALGTPAYMPPEQVRGGDSITPRADVYALGASLYEALVLRPPFGLVEREVLYRRILHDDPDDLGRLVPHLPRALGWIVHRCLEKDPRRRYADAGALGKDLARLRESKPTMARPVSPLRRMARLVRRRPVAASLLLASLFAVLALSVFAWHLRRTAATQSTLAALAAMKLSDQNPLPALLLARNLFERERTPAARSALIAAMLGAHQTDEVVTPYGLQWARASPDGRTLLCAAYDREGTVGYATSSAAGTWSRVLVHGGYSAAWAPDGRFAMAAGNRPPALFDAAGDRVQLEPLDPPLEFIHLDGAAARASIAFDADGNLVAGDRTGHIQVFDRQGRAGAHWQPHGKWPIHSLWLLDDGRVLTVSAANENITRSSCRLRAVAVSSPEAQEGDVLLEAQPGHFEAIELSGDGRKLFVGLVHERRSAVHCIDTVTREHTVVEFPSMRQVSALATDEHGDFVVLAGDKKVAWFGAERMARFVDRLDSKPSAVAVWNGSEDGTRRLAVAEHLGPIRVYSLPGVRRTAVLRGHKDSVRHLQFMADGEELLSASMDGTVRRWRLALPDLPEMRAQGPVFAGAWLPDGEHVVLLSGDAISLHHRSGRMLASAPAAPQNPGALLAVAGPGHRLAAGAWLVASMSRNDSVKFWRCSPRDQSLTLAHAPEGRQRAWGEALRFTARHELVVVGLRHLSVYGPDGELQWRGPQHENENTIGGDIRPAARLLVRCMNGRPGIELHLLATNGDGRLVGAEVDGTHAVSPTAVAFDPVDDDRLLLALRDGRVVHFDRRADTERLICRHERAVTSISFSADGRLVLSTSRDGFVRVHTRAGEPVVELPHGDIVWGAAFSPDGRHVLSVGSNETARIWPIDDEEVLRLADKLAFRGWYDGEEDQFVGGR